MAEQPYVDRYLDLVNNISRPERAAVYLSMNHSSLSAREDFPGGGQNLGQSRERTLGRIGESRAEERASRGISINYAVNLVQR